MGLLPYAESYPLTVQYMYRKTPAKPMPDARMT
jgi:hypothetical protein